MGRSAKTERNIAIRAAYLSNLSLQDVANQHGITRERVRQILANMGVHERHFGNGKPENVAARKAKAAAAEKSAEIRAQRKASRDELWDKICALYIEGKKYDEICEALGRNSNFKSYVLQVVRRRGLPGRAISAYRAKQRLTPSERDIVCRRYGAGEDVYAIAKDFGIVPSYVYTLASSAGWGEVRRMR